MSELDRRRRSALRDLKGSIQLLDEDELDELYRAVMDARGRRYLSTPRQATVRLLKVMERAGLTRVTETRTAADILVDADPREFRFISGCGNVTMAEALSHMIRKFGLSLSPSWERELERLMLKVNYRELTRHRPTSITIGPVLAVLKKRLRDRNAPGGIHEFEESP